MMPQKIISHKKAHKAQENTNQSLNDKSGFVLMCLFVANDL
jgi:hypothetical protein